MERKYTKCECCPYYAKMQDDNTKKQKWICTRSYCIFDYGKGCAYEERIKVLKNWLNANNNIEV